ncbi:MAG: Maltodextrin ABC transporter, permease protein MdxF [uncultured Truepera sp.]|uniref:Maltodextrin ABC transporter, permease protein MdxF n=1 Tax=uncultured Truepera sp. TaxID=543023 RepID=A0A6J4VRI1_9DEIN|nr:MAG: Maltodextrin ABC transporter, permease protein MdxF [uncultured Truepera sp.]
MALQPKPYKRPGFWARLASGNPSEAQLGYLLLVPAFTVLALVMLYPILNVVWKSLHYEKLNNPARGTPFIGLENFHDMAWGEGLRWSVTHLLVWRLLLLGGVAALWATVRRRARGQAVGWTVLLLAVWALLGIHPGAEGEWNDPRFWNAFGVSLLIIVVSVLGSFVVGLPLALVADIKTRWRWLVRVALLLPWAMPPVLIGLMFAWLFQDQYGVVNDLLRRVGVEGPIWLARVVPAIVAVNYTLIWKTSSFVGLVLLAGLQSIDRGLYEAAEVDGASVAQRFWQITLPLLRPAIAVALIFRTLTAIQTFDVPFAMTRGGPGRALETLGIYVYNTTLTLDIGYAAALSVALFLLSLAITVFYLRWIYTE